jgi:hypothetical protein
MAAGAANGQAATPAGAGGPDSRRWLILAVIALAQLMIVLDSRSARFQGPKAPARWRARWAVMSALISTVPDRTAAIGRKACSRCQSGSCI